MHLKATINPAKIESKHNFKTNDAHKLRLVNVPKKYASLVRLIVKHSSPDLTTNEFLNITDVELLRIPKLGANKLSLTKELKALISNQNSTESITHKPNLQAWLKPPRNILNAYSINCNELSEYQHAINRISSKLRIPPHKLTVANITHDVFDGNGHFILNGVSRERYDLLVGVIANSYDEVASQTTNESEYIISSGSPIFFNGFIKINNSTLDFVINADLACALNKMSERQAFIFKSRLGMLENPKLTLDEIGRSFSPVISRERVRQLQNKQIKKLKEALSIHPKNILANIRASINHGTLSSRYPLLASQLSSEAGLARFFNLICEVNVA